MPQTVWDYVAKLKTSVTKASIIHSIFSVPYKIILIIY